MSKKVLIIGGCGLLLLVIAYFVYKHEANKPAEEFEDFEDDEQENNEADEKETEQQPGTGTGTEKQ